MREIKFRVWCEARKEMLPIQRHSFKTNKSMPYGWNMQYEFDAIMQYTGLKDKNGTEIYEGDIVDATYCIDRCLYYSEDEYGIVVWDDKKFGFFIKFKNEIDVTPISYYEYLKVIGNIYENPELLD